MASSTYQVMMEFSTRTDMTSCAEVWNKVARKELPSWRMGSIKDMTESEKKQPYPALFLTEGDTHTCRETLIGSIRYMYNRLLGTNFEFTNCVRFAHVIYMKEHGQKLDQKRLEKIKLVVGKINRITLPMAFSFFKTLDGNDVVGVTIRNPQNEQFMLMSFLFWIFRNDSMLDFVVKLCEGVYQISLNDVMIRLSKEFALLSSSWDDANGGNAAILLSIYAYAYSKGMLSNIGNYSGPVNLIYSSLSLTVGMEYLKELYIPLVKKQEENTRWLLDGCNGSPNMNSLVSLFHLLLGEKKSLGKSPNDLYEPVDRD